jgi:hypothetical protein
MNDKETADRNDQSYETEFTWKVKKKIGKKGSENDGEKREAIDCKTKEKSENEMDVFAIERGYEKTNKN